jgi:hypothetical protein
MKSFAGDTSYARDPYAEARERALLAKRTVDSDMQEMNRSLEKAPLASARKYFSENEQELSPGVWQAPQYAMSETSPLSDSGALQHEMQGRAAGSAFNLVADVKNAKDYSEASVDAAEQQADASRTGSIIGAVGKIASTALPFVLCDERCKHSVAPLNSCEVNDELAQLAYVVKWLSEQP